MLDRELMGSVYDELQKLRASLFEVRNETDTNELRYKSLLNLNQYIKLRSDDYTKLQEKLSLLSLSSLGRSYSHVAASVDTLHDQLCCSLGHEEISKELMEDFHHLFIQDAINIASDNAKALFGGKSSSKMSRQKTALMITLPSNAADDEGKLIRKLATSHVDIFRINTAHDTPQIWKEMADIIASENEYKEKHEKMKIFVDLAGPKIRTGKIRKIDLSLEVGSNKTEKEIWLYHRDEESKPEETDPKTLQKFPAQIVVEKDFFKSLKKGSTIQAHDMNTKIAEIRVLEIDKNVAKCVINKKLFLDKQSVLIHKKKESFIKNIQTQSELIRVFIDDKVRITQKDLFGRASRKDDNGKIIEPALIGCGGNRILEYVKLGEKVFIDDGKLGLEVVEMGEDEITCKVILAKENGVVIKEEKGINFPNSYIRTSALTELDKENLLEVIGFADSLSISFCQSADDVKKLQDLLSSYGREDIGIIAKIETKQAVSNMPSILKQLLKSKNSGVMIARGDLAIEVGFENLPHIQEALLDICDAAHMPVIWATQVLESKMKNNLPSRAEVTDAAMSSRAECVMLNKGPFTFDTIDVLISILHDMHSIFKKNKQLLKKETMWNS
ncbi:MAG: pyruvate kinase [Thiovulaceae bacterium]|nr:pyruvate kinase [Sulfurimonadaceae bacterium]